MERAYAALLVGLFITVTACGSNQPAYDEMANTGLERADLGEVNAVYDPGEGVVHLRGTVANESDRRRVDDVVRQAVGDGVEVANEVTVEGASAEMADDFDGSIRTRLKNEIEADEQLHERAIDFDVSNGVVTITGNVADDREKERASELARGAPGVRDVINVLEVHPSLPR
jgi:osmotically-inducible protein OsmY